MRLFTVAKASHRSWMDHFLYLKAVSGGADTLALDNIVYYADSHMRTTMLYALDLNRNDPYVRLKSWRNSHNRRRLKLM